MVVLRRSDVSVPPRMSLPLTCYPFFPSLLQPSTIDPTGEIPSSPTSILAEPGWGEREWLVTFANVTPNTPTPYPVMSVDVPIHGHRLVDPFLNQDGMTRMQESLRNPHLAIPIRAHLDLVFPLYTLYKAYLQVSRLNQVAHDLQTTGTPPLIITVIRDICHSFWCLPLTLYWCSVFVFLLFHLHNADTSSPLLSSSCLLLYFLSRSQFPLSTHSLMVCAWWYCHINSHTRLSCIPSLYLPRNTYCFPWTLKSLSLRSTTEWTLYNQSSSDSSLCCPQKLSNLWHYDLTRAMTDFTTSQS